MNLDPRLVFEIAAVVLTFGLSAARTWNRKRRRLAVARAEVAVMAAKQTADLGDDAAAELALRIAKGDAEDDELEAVLGKADPAAVLALLRQLVKR